MILVIFVSIFQLVTFVIDSGTDDILFLSKFETVPQ